MFFHVLIVQLTGLVEETLRYFFDWANSEKKVRKMGQTGDANVLSKDHLSIHAIFSGPKSQKLWLREFKSDMISQEN